MLTSEEMERIVDAVIKRTDDRYVHQDNCDTRHNDIDKRQTANELTVAVHGNQISTLIKVLATVGSAAAVALIGIAVKVIFGG